MPWIDEAGSLKVGYSLQGRFPGLWLYGKGGEDPTTTGCLFADRKAFTEEL